MNIISEFLEKKTNHHFFHCLPRYLAVLWRITIWQKQLTFFIASFRKHMRKLFFDKLYQFFFINSPFVLVTFNNTFTMWYCHHELCYAYLRTFFFSLCATCRFEAFAPPSPRSHTKRFCMGCWIAFVDPRSTIKVEWYTFCPEICVQFFPLISKI